MYRFTYSVGFAALIAASAAEVHYWTDNYWADSRALDAGVLYLLIPLMLIVINCFGIEVHFPELPNRSLLSNYLIQPLDRFTDGSR